jgi:hypothetical protein
MGPALYPLLPYAPPPSPPRTLQLLNNLTNTPLGSPAGSPSKGVVHAVLDPKMSPYFRGLIIPTNKNWGDHDPFAASPPSKEPSRKHSPLTVSHLEVGFSPSKRLRRARKLNF